MSDDEPIPIYPVDEHPNGNGVDDEQLRRVGDRNSENKRNQVPEGVGDECPVCGAPYDTGASGPMWSDVWNSVDAFAWVRVCSGAAPGVFTGFIEAVHDYPAESVPYCYIHKDGHIDDE